MPKQLELDIAGHQQEFNFYQGDKMSVPQTIKDQIMAMDYWALGRFGANSYTGSGAGGNVVIEEKEYPHEGYLGFKCSGSKLKRGRVIVALNGKDLYDVYSYTVQKCQTKLREEVQDVYVEDLVTVLADMIG